MADTLVDSNVLLDLFTQDSDWGDWSSRSLSQAALRGAIAINPIIYAEISVRFESINELEQVLSLTELERLDLPWEAAFTAGKCFQHYRRKGGERRSPLPDFYIGAHAAIKGFSLLTRDPTRYRTYFPKLEIIAPD